MASEEERLAAAVAAAAREKGELSLEQWNELEALHARGTIPRREWIELVAMRLQRLERQVGAASQVLVRIAMRPLEDGVAEHLRVAATLMDEFASAAKQAAELLAVNPSRGG